MTVPLRVEVLHGVNLDQLARRDPAHYGDLDLHGLERQIAAYGDELGLVTSFFHTNHEGEYVERIHRAAELADGLLLNPGAWTHYAWSLHDAVELSGLPAVEIHLSDVDAREAWRRVSVLAPVCRGRVAGRGVAGYRDALVLLQDVITRGGH